MHLKKGALKKHFHDSILSDSSWCVIFVMNIAMLK